MIILSKGNIADQVSELAKPIVESLNYELVDVEFVKEASNWYLRLYIDKEGGITIDDCEAASKLVGKMLDEKDPIEQSYFLEVSSPGLDRPLKKESDFIKYKGKDVEVRLYKPLEGKKVFEGELVGLVENKIVIMTDGSKMEFPQNEVSVVKLAVKF